MIDNMALQARNASNPAAAPGFRASVPVRILSREINFFCKKRIRTRAEPGG
jgi:hypothetical protein